MWLARCLVIRRAAVVQSTPRITASTDYRSDSDRFTVVFFRDFFTVIGGSLAAQGMSPQRSLANEAAMPERCNA